jgi:hypothetical protein
MCAHRPVREHPRQIPAQPSQRQPRRRRGHPVPVSGNSGGRIISHTGRGVVGIGPQPPISPPAVLTWQPGRIHQLAKMRLIDLIALYQSMLPDTTGEHDQVAQTAAGGWTKDQVITAIRNLEAPYEQVGGWKRAMEIIATRASVEAEAAGRAGLAGRRARRPVHPALDSRIKRHGTLGHPIGGFL